MLGSLSAPLAIAVAGCLIGRRRRPVLLLSACLLSTCVLSGCGGAASTGRVAFTGRVTLHGAPVQQGTVSFLPAEGHPGGPAANAQIEAGAFRFDAATGPVPGPYDVLVTAIGAPNKGVVSIAVGSPQRTFQVQVTDRLDFPTEFELAMP